MLMTAKAGTSCYAIIEYWCRFYVIQAKVLTRKGMLAEIEGDEEMLASWKSKKSSRSMS